MRIINVRKWHVRKFQSAQLVMCANKMCATSMCSNDQCSNSVCAKEHRPTTTDKLQWKSYSQQLHIIFYNLIVSLEECSLQMEYSRIKNWARNWQFIPVFWINLKVECSTSSAWFNYLRQAPFGALIQKLIVNDWASSNSIYWLGVVVETSGEHLLTNV